MRPVVKLLRLQRLPILQQLRLEEALLRADGGNWFLLNNGTPEVTIVMGISGKAEQLVHIPEALAAGVTVIKRFSGGGTVAVDRDTVFGTLIMNAAALPAVECYPRPIMAWSEGFYSSVFLPHGPFGLRDNDYIFGERKFGGNAQAITRNRWLHHTSFLWDYQSENMRLLQHPERTPEYRAGRDHLDFVSRLKDVLPDRDQMLEDMVAALSLADFDVQEATLEEAQELLKRDYLRSTKVVDLRGSRSG